MFIKDFDYDLPKELIAQQPPARRDESRLMVVKRREGTIEHARFADFPKLMNESDLLVLNDTRVIPARVWGKRGEADAEFLFVRELEPGVWEALCRPARKVREGERIVFVPGIEGVVAREGAAGLRTLRFGRPDVLAVLREVGYAPLPPYIKRPRGREDLRSGDLERYQTVFARKEGAIAAPTAGLHFTPRVLSAVRKRGVDIRKVTLEVGVATFQPVRAERIEDHHMLEERYEILPAAARAINAAKAGGRPIVAVGTTVVRALESAAGKGGVRAGKGATSLFIRPGYEFKVVDRLLTNFHLPKSTLLMLVSAFAGTDLIIRHAYREAVRERYRFFSYGDCMLIV
jgi:S-adenosylmethionine:tRNA ribosyltransferase-isomerase